jgi:hypothetical protein
MSLPAAIERVRFVHGQRLPAADLRDAVRGELRRQELHVVAAHRTWGIALGLEVRAGVTAARVQPGAAFDVRGRVLALRCEAVAVAPELLVKAEKPVELVIALRDGCATVRFSAEADVRLGLDVPLAGFTPKDGELGEPDLTRRRFARSLARARIGRGTATIQIDPTSGSPYAGAFVDTSVAGFVRRPSYVITRVAADEIGAEASAFVWIADASPGGFTVRIWTGAGAVKKPFELELDWLGAEPPLGCTPPPRIPLEEERSP